jgi:hypothetical protein
VRFSMVIAALAVVSVGGCQKSAPVVDAHADQAPAAENLAQENAARAADAAADGNAVSAGSGSAAAAPAAAAGDRKWYVVEAGCTPVETTLAMAKPTLLPQLESGASSDEVEVDDGVARLRHSGPEGGMLVFVRGLDACRNMSKLIH